MNHSKANSCAPLRTHEERERFFDAYFDSVGAITFSQSPNYREYELPRDVDKEMTDRPFYWMWVEKTGQPITPTRLRIAFTEDAVERENQRLRDEAFKRAEEENRSEMERRFLRPPTAEYVTLGSFRLNKLYDSVDTRGRFACVRIGTSPASRLVPWLVVNVLVSFRCDLVEQSYQSYGVCLDNRQVVEGFYDKIKNLTAHPADPNSLLAGSTASIADGLAMLKTRIESDLRKLPTDWASEAMQRLVHDTERLNTYYDSLIASQKPRDEVMLIEQERVKKMHEAKEKSEPRIELAMKQIALVGLPER